jgi:hypothetical protein
MRSLTAIIGHQIVHAISKLPFGTAVDAAGTAIESHFAGPVNGYALVVLSDACQALKQAATDLGNNLITETSPYHDRLARRILDGGLAVTVFLESEEFAEVDGQTWEDLMGIYPNATACEIAAVCGQAYHAVLDGLLLEVA